MLDHESLGLHRGGVLPLGPEYFLTDDHQLSLAASSHSSAAVQSLVQHSASAQSAGPASTLVGSSNGLEINLIWDSSVRAAANWQSVESDVAAAARVYTGAFSNHVVINIAVGFGEVDGSHLGSGALGESSSNGYLVSYGNLQSALGAGDAALIQSGAMSASAIQALQSLHGESFFVTSAEAKALGLVSGSSNGVDGYIGLSTSSQMSFAGGVKAGQYDAVGVAAHEISEVLGRMGLEGQSLGGRADVYTPLDLFRYTAAHTPDTKPTAGYFSTNNGASSLELFNNPGNGGDAADWATASINTTNAFDAYDNPGVTTQVTSTDLLAIAVLGYQVAAGHILTSAAA